MNTSMGKLRPKGTRSSSEVPIRALESGENRPENLLPAPNQLAPARNSTGC